ncbi:hypothetical protein HPB50_025242 [Hyalomma asiaticum]|uniref:Uncharacterized protein n=1 Tax=Hyalomma asiaticum TaxID=266040 RepID=A0ACB7SIJ9_HYAAI|nr:hypothetical protein HPB50_025242 [Hyalomma asiaticum]
MNPELHPGRGLERAAALHTQHSDRPGVFYINVSGSSPSGHFMAAVTTEGKHVDGLSFRSDMVTHAEEVSIALAASHPTSRIILTDSRSACSQYLQGFIAPLAARLLQAASWHFNPHSIRVVWTPNHSGLPGNEATMPLPHFSYPGRCPSMSRNGIWQQQPDALSSNFGLLPGFAPPLPGPRTRSGESGRTTPTPPADEHLCRPAVARNFSPEINGTCSTCQVLTDIYHVVAC